MTTLYDLAVPLLRLLPPETAHRVTIRALAAGLAPRSAPPDPASLGISLWGRRFPNPIGLAAGFDKNAEVPDAMLGFGFGFVECGTVTPRPQPGNPRPRLFRLLEDRALINRLGFNNEGLDAVRARLAARRGRPGLVGGNLGKNKDSTDAVADYVAGVAALAPLVDYLVVNVSSPNTPGLRDLQRKSALLDLIAALRRARARQRQRQAAARRRSCSRSRRILQHPSAWRSPRRRWRPASTGSSSPTPRWRGRPASAARSRERPAA